MYGIIISVCGHNESQYAGSIPDGRGGVLHAVRRDICYVPVGYRTDKKHFAVRVDN
jgi:hypothetical protein